MDLWAPFYATFAAYGGMRSKGASRPRYYLFLKLTSFPDVF
jgi:hypothetical protein